MFDNMSPGDRRVLMEMYAKLFGVIQNRAPGPFSQYSSSNGQQTIAYVPAKDVFLAKITDVCGSGLSATYSFVEMQIADDGTGPEQVTDGREAYCVAPSASLGVRPARYDLSDTLQEDDLVLARVSIANSNEFEILSVVSPGGGSGGGSGCSPDFAWVLAKNVLTYTGESGEIKAKAMAFAVTEATGLCACAGMTVPQGDAPLIRYLDDPAGGYDPQDGDARVVALYDDGADAWPMMGSFTGCCGACWSGVFEIDLVQTPLGEVPILTVTLTGTKCDSGAAATFAMLPVCGDNDGAWVKFVAFSEAVCDWPPTADKDCDNHFAVVVKCIDCDLPNVGCAACAELVGPPAFKVVVDGTTIYPVADADCSCTWSDECSGATLTVDGTTVTLVYDGETYVYDTNDDTPGENYPPSCWEEHTLDQVGSGGGSATVAPVSCLPVEPVTQIGCSADIAWPESLNVTYTSGCGEFSFTITGGYSAGTVEYSGSVGDPWTVPPVDCDQNASLQMQCTSAGSGGFTLSSTASKCGPDGCSPVVLSMVPFVATFDCAVVPIEGCAGNVTGIIWQGDSLWWCVENDGTYSCVQSATPPTGWVSVAGTQEDCEAKCGCEGVVMLMAAAGVAADSGVLEVTGW